MDKDLMQERLARICCLAYWRWLERLPGLRAGIFLTPSGFAAACPHFVAVSYLDLLRCSSTPHWLKAGRLGRGHATRLRPLQPTTAAVV